MRLYTVGETHKYTNTDGREEVNGLTSDHLHLAGLQSSLTLAPRLFSFFHKIVDFKKTTRPTTHAQKPVL